MLGYNQPNLQFTGDLADGLFHDIFVGGVRPTVRRMSNTAYIYQDAPQGMFKFSGERTVWAVDLHHKTNGVNSDGRLPDFIGRNAVQGFVVPTRRYVPIAIDNLTQLLGEGEGTFKSLIEWVTDDVWESYASLEKFNAVAASSGIVCLTAERLTDSSVKVKDGYGHPGMNPILHMGESSILGWWDVSEDQPGGVGQLIGEPHPERDGDGFYTLEFQAAWEQGTNPIAPEDPIYFATTPNFASDRFILGRNLAPNGVGTIADPRHEFTVVLGIDEEEHPRWSPYRQQSVTIDSFEVSQFWTLLGSKRGYDVSSQTDVTITHPSVGDQITKSLIGFQQMSDLGGTLRGGYDTDGASGNSEEYRPTAAFSIGGKQGYVDGFFYQDVLKTCPYDGLYRVEVGGDADFWSGDGSMWNRIIGFDGKDGFVPHYMNYVSNDRGSIGMLLGIVTDRDPDDYAPAIRNDVEFY